MNAHDPRQHHASYHSYQSESVVLKAADLAAKAEDILADEACGFSVDCCLYRRVRHALYLAMDWPRVLALLRGRRKLVGLRLQPLVEIFLRHHVQIGLHVVVAGAAH